MNTIEKATITVSVNGVREIRDVSHYLTGDNGKEAIPVLRIGESFVRLLNGECAVYGATWPEPVRTKPKDYQRLYGQTFNEVEKDD